MTRLTSFIISFFLFIFLIHSNTYAVLKINEIYPLPHSGEYEWIELYNDEDTTIDLSIYTISDLANNQIKFASSIIQPFEFQIASSTSVLNNSGDTIFLKNNQDEIIESVTYSSLNSGQTYAKCPDSIGSWFVLDQPTLKIANSTACAVLTPTPTIQQVSEANPTTTPTLTVTPTSSPTPTLTVTPPLYQNIYISEIMAYPNNGENEWLEIYNDNDFLVILDNWYYDDLENSGSSPKAFSQQLAAKSYSVIDLTSTMYNNDRDSVRLLDSNKILKDSFEYNSATQGKTWGRITFDTDFICEQEPSQGINNLNCLSPTTSPTVINQDIPIGGESNSPNKPTIIKTPASIKTPTPSKTTVKKTAVNSKKSSAGNSLQNYYSTTANESSYNDLSASDSFEEDNGDVLASTSYRANRLNNPLIKSLSFLSFAFSSMVFFSVILKIFILNK